MSKETEKPFALLSSKSINYSLFTTRFHWVFSSFEMACLQDFKQALKPLENYQ